MYFIFFSIILSTILDICLTREPHNFSSCSMRLLKSFPKTNYLLCLSTLKSSRPVLTCNATPETPRMTMSGGAGLKAQLSKQVIGAYCYFGGSMCLSCSGSGFLPRAALVYCAELKSVWWMMTPGCLPTIPCYVHSPGTYLYSLQRAKVLRISFYPPPWFLNASPRHVWLNNIDKAAWGKNRKRKTNKGLHIYSNIPKHEKCVILSVKHGGGRAWHQAAFHDITRNQSCTSTNICKSGHIEEAEEVSLLMTFLTEWKPKRGPPSLTQRSLIPFTEHVDKWICIKNYSVDPY